MGWQVLLPLGDVLPGISAGATVEEQLSIVKKLPFGHGQCIGRLVSACVYFKLLLVSRLLTSRLPKQVELCSIYHPWEERNECYQ